MSPGHHHDRHDQVDVRTTLGVPFMPPASVSEWSTRLRDLVGRTHRRMAPPPVQILEAALSLLEHRVLVAICEAGVPDALDSTTTIGDLAHEVNVAEERLERLLRFASARGWLRIDRRSRVHPNAVTRFLRTDHPAGWRSWVDFMAGDEITNAIAAVDLRRSGNGFADTNGSAFFDWMAAHPQRWATFDAAMAAGARMHALTLDAAIDWADAGTICDVGGGTGELVRVLLDRHPTWTGVVFDLPSVIDRAVEHPRLTAIAGDAFRSVPPGHDVYLLVNVLHDWNDHDCERILTTIAGSADGEARLIVIDNERRDVPRDDIGLRADILMAALTDGGHERNTEQFVALGRRAGLHHVESTPLASRDRAHEFRTNSR